MYLRVQFEIQLAYEAWFKLVVHVFFFNLRV